MELIHTRNVSSPNPDVVPCSSGDEKCTVVYVLKLYRVK